MKIQNLILILILIDSSYSNLSKIKKTQIALQEDEIALSEDIKYHEDYMPGADRDEHGCCGSCGQSWCELNQRCIFPWMEKCEKDKINDEHN